jgi:hypothetical protein
MNKRKKKKTQRWKYSRETDMHEIFMRIPGKTYS